MKLVKEQIELLNDEIEYLETGMAEARVVVSNMGGGATLAVKSDPSASEFRRQLIVCDDRLRAIRSILRDAEIIDRDSDVIGIGSRVSLFLDFGDDDFTEDNYIDFILIEKRVGKESSDRFITIDSTLGKSIVGKRVNDKFSYKTCSGHVIEGIIMKCGVKEDKDLQIVKR